jgi:hypothetical protein
LVGDREARSDFDHVVEDASKRASDPPPHLENDKRDACLVKVGGFWFHGEGCVNEAHVDGVSDIDKRVKDSAQVG